MSAMIPPMTPSRMRMGSSALLAARLAMTPSAVIDETYVGTTLWHQIYNRYTAPKSGGRELGGLLV